MGVIPGGSQVRISPVEHTTQAFFAEEHRRLWTRRAFYRRAFEEDSQNSIWRYLVQFSTEANKAALKAHLGVGALSRKLAVSTRHFAYGNVSCVVEWLRGDFEATPAQLASDMFACMPPELCAAYASQGSSGQAPY